MLKSHKDQTIMMWSRARRRFNLSSPPPPCPIITDLLDRSSKDLSAFCRKFTDWTPWCSLSAATTRTFLVRPPTVVISAKRVSIWRYLSVSMRSCKRSGLSSQQNDTLKIIRRPSSLEQSSKLSTLISSVSDGNVSSVISRVCCFNSLTRWTTLASSVALSVCVKKIKNIRKQGKRKGQIIRICLDSRNFVLMFNCFQMWKKKKLDNFPDKVIISFREKKDL